MAVLTRDQIAPIDLPAQECDVPAIGGTVLVRGMDLPAWLRFAAARRRVEAPLEGETPEDTDQRVGGAMMPVVLNLCVMADDGQPVYSPAQWGHWGARHPAEAMQLFQLAMQLSGQDGDLEKKA